MVKFDHEKDFNYHHRVRVAFEEVVGSVFVTPDTDVLQETNDLCKVVVRPQIQSSRFPRMQKDRNSGFLPEDGLSAEIRDMGSSSFLGHTIATALLSVDHMIQDIIQNYDDLSVSAEDATPGTCEWIQKSERYVNWLHGPSNSVLFLEGHPGTGKSVLARSIVESFKGGSPVDGTSSAADTSTSRPAPLVTASFCRKGREYNTPLAILKHILFQIGTADSDLLHNAVQRSFFTTRQRNVVDIEVYWHILKAIRSHMRRDLVCIIDGFDECVDSVRKDEKQTAVLSSFFRYIVKIGEDVDVQQRARTKVLITTQPRTEIATTISTRYRFLIQAADVQEDVRSFVHHRVTRMAESRDFSTELQVVVIDEVFQKCNPIFQMADHLLDQLQKCNLGDTNEVRQIIAECPPPREFAAAYERTLDLLEARYRAPAGRLIRLLHFLSHGLSADEICHALAARIDDPSVEKFIERTKISHLDLVMSGRLGFFIKKDVNETFDLQHASIKDFFRDLSQERFPEFSCADEREGHLYLAHICIGFLMVCRRLPVTQEEVADAKGKELSARCKKYKFVQYAARYWHFHLKRAEELAVKDIELLHPFLGTGTAANADFALMCSIRRMHDSEDDKPLSANPHEDLPVNFLACHGLTFALLFFFRPLRSKLHRLRQWGNQKSSSIPNVKPFPAVNKINLRDGNERSVLFYACENGHLDTVLFLLSSGAEGRLVDSKGCTPFSLAVENGHEGIAVALIDAGYTYKRTRKPQQPDILTMATTFEMECVVQHLLAGGHQPNDKSYDGWTPTLIAATTDSLSTFKLLFDNGGSRDDKLENGRTALALAAAHGNLEIVRELFQRWPKTLDPAPVDKYGMTPLHLAATYGHEAIFHFLLEKQHEVSGDEVGFLPIHCAAVRGSLVMVAALCEKTSTLQTLTKNSRHALHFAARQGHLPIVRYLVEVQNVSPNITFTDSGVQPGEACHKNITPLYLALYNGHEEIVKFLLPVTTNLKALNYDGETILHLAARKGCLDVLKELVSRDAIALPRSDGGYTPFHSACVCNSLSIVKAYVCGEVTEAASEDFDINHAADNGHTGLTLAAWNGSAEVLDFLLQEGKINPRLTVGGGYSALHYATSSEDPSCVSLLLNHLGSSCKAHVNLRSNDGGTALLIAACMNNVKIARLLIAAGADLEAKTNEGDTPLILAATNRSKSMVKFFLEAGADATGPRNCLGLNAYEICARNPAMAQILGSFSAATAQLDTGNHEYESLRFIKEELDNFLTSTGSQSFPDVNRLAMAFHELGDEDALRICFEASIVSPLQQESFFKGFACDHCQKEDVVVPVQACLQCFNCHRCQECVKLGDDGLPEGCSSDHRHVSIGGDSWKALAPGTVDQTGRTLRQWCMDMRESCSIRLAALSPTTEDQNPAQTDFPTAIAVTAKSEPPDVTSEIDVLKSSTRQGMKILTNGAEGGDGVLVEHEVARPLITHASTWETPSPAKGNIGRLRKRFTWDSNHGKAALLGPITRLQER